ncbi:MAG TPA: NUDIX domain-containing protein [Nitrososphaerales archaeon]|nr:NUDIX domain-containing protein [Nitrososphaerales archaeon]
MHDGVIGASTIARCLKEGLLHRAVAVLVLRTSGKIVLQQRGKGDLWQPGMWTISSTGHVKQGESYEEAARRELGEELGLEGELKRFHKYCLPPIAEGGLTEHEWVTLFICRTDSHCRIDYVELDGVREVTIEELRGMLADGPLTPDAKTILSDYLSRGS